MKTVKRLNIKDKNLFTNVTNVNDFDPGLLLINEFTIFGDRSTMLEITYCEKNNVPYIVFNNVECILEKVVFLVI